MCFWHIQATNITTNIADEIAVVHKYIRDRYASKFRELETLVPNPIEYARTVKQIANQTVRITLLSAISTSASAVPSFYLISTLFE